ncbi:isochorismate synthase [Mycetocola tolaasinivorans]|uniref:isochorismate synthase n=1 Tax=Mycetocola tolaasinivorans TaxID=76635 RepID=A0A3L7A633_9MICO|nr:chorismate-binding protein [Mycetocola tolaasinivorans]RLP75687.1 isochorismate synthase [Mycetocola tolaasinivorans]
MSSRVIPRLHVTTRALADPGTLFGFASRTDPLIWMRGGAGIVGSGEALRLVHTGEDRITDLAADWQSVAASARVDDDVRLPGTGLIAFGTIAFSAASATESVLIVPRQIVGRSGEHAWITEISIDGEAYPEGAPVRTPLGESVTVPLAEDADADQRHQALVRTALERIARGDVAKVVLARTLTGRLPEGADRRRLAADLAAAYPQCWTYAVDGMIGASPETLISVRAGSLSLRVLAGTAARGHGAEADQAAADTLLESRKDRDEHAYAVRSALAALGPHAAGLHGQDSPFTLRLPNLWHLATDISGRISDRASVLDLIQALHPTAAVGGTPTAAAIDLIDELEPFDRGRYAGPTGWVDAHGNGDWAIALRGAQVDPAGDITAYAGGGIVAGSDPASEFRETGIKFRPIRDALS